MKTRKRIILFVVTFLFVLTVSGCGSSKKELDFSAGDNAEFVKTVAQAITNREDTPDLFVNSSSILYDLEAEPLFQPFFAMMYMKAQEDENDPSLVHYSCRIPGLVGTCFNMAYQTYYGSIWRHSKWVSAEGDVRVVTDKEGNPNKFNGNWYVASSLGFVPQILSIGMDTIGKDTHRDISGQLRSLLFSMTEDAVKFIPEGAAADHPSVKGAESLLFRKVEELHQAVETLR